MEVLEGIQRTEGSQASGKAWYHNQAIRFLGQVPSLLSAPFWYLNQSPLHRLAFLAHWFTEQREITIASPCLHLSIQTLGQNTLKFLIQFPDPRKGNLIGPPFVRRPLMIQTTIMGQVEG